MSNKAKSWRTSTAGIVLLIAAVAKAIGYELDNNPATIADWAMVIGMASAALGLWHARDNGVTSEGTKASSRP